jgi:hemoglobin-like flavoprotein
LPETIEEKKATMIAERRRLVIESWKLLAPNAEQAGAAIYRRLFEIDPTLRPLFAGTLMDGQVQKVVTMMDLIVQWLDVPERLVPVLKQLGERHAKYGVQDEHYGKMNTAILGALEEGLGDKFTIDVRSAWTEALVLISSLMRRGAAKISGTFPALNVEGDGETRRAAASDAA